MSKADLTLTDVMGAVHDLTEAVQEGFSRVEARLDNVETRLDNHDSRFDLLDARIDQRFGLLSDRLDLVDTRLKTLGGDLSKTTNIILDVQEEVVSHNVSFEHEARRYFDHEKRIVALEAVAA